MDPKELRLDRATKLDRASKIRSTAAREARNLTDAENIEFHSCIEQSTKLLEQAEVLEEHSRIMTQLAQPINRRVAVMTPGDFGNGMWTPEHAVLNAGPDSLRSYRGYSDRDARELAYRDGRWFMAVAGHKPSVEWCAGQGIDIRAQAEGVNTAGGVTVPVEMVARIIRLVAEYGLARGFAFNWPMARDTMTIPRRTGGLTAHFVGENVQGSESDMTFDAVELNAKKLMTLTRVSSELNDDSIISIADLLMTEIALAFATKEDECLIDGTGIAAHGGIIGFRTKMVDGLHNASHFDMTAHDQMLEVTTADLSSCMGLLPEYVREPKWYCSQAFRANVFHRLAIAATGVSAAEIASMKMVEEFMGYPIIRNPLMPAGVVSVYNGTILAAFGDLRMAAALGDRRDMTVQISTERWFEFDQLGVKGTERIDIVVHDIGDNTNAGPLVGLCGNTA